MAKQIKSAEGKAPNGVNATDLRRAVKDITKHKEHASENQGLAGQATKDAIERYNLDRKALAVVLSLTKKEPSQQQATLRALVDYADKLGMFDQVDMYDDLLPTLERILDRAKNSTTAENAGRGPGAEVVKDLVH